MKINRNNIQANPLDFDKKFGSRRIMEFVDFINKVNKTVGFKVSSRGWAYILEQKGFVNKSQFDKVEQLVNRARKRGLLPVDFVAEESARNFLAVHKPTRRTYEEQVKYYLDYVLYCKDWFEPNWWRNEEYYIQMIVEKVDLVTLFYSICNQYHIPIANAKGWSSVSQRAEYARRFKQAERQGKKCVLLYCGDHDPDGLRISDTLRKNLEDISDVVWSDGVKGYDPSNLIIDRFGLNYDFIINNDLTWIDNLITGGGEIAKINNGVIVPGKTKGGRIHPNFDLPYAQDYIRNIGVRKCEANALVVAPDSAKVLCEQAIQKYTGKDALSRFKILKDEAVNSIEKIIEENKLEKKVKKLIDKLKV